MTTGSINKHHDMEYEEVRWEIPNFLSHLKENISIKSPSFNFSYISWELEMKCDSKNVISLYISRNTSGIQISVMYKFGILLTDGTTEMRSTFIKSFSDSDSRSGTRRFIPKSKLEERKHELLPGGIFTISCSLTYKFISTKPENSKFERFDVLSSNLEALYGSIKTNDITIVVGEQKYPAMKAMLAARSSVFAEMFQHDMEAKTGIINVVDCDAASFKDFLLYLNTGKVENVSPSNVCHLYRTAAKYNVKELKVFCLHYMKRNLSVENILDIVILANQFNETEVISLAQEYFNKNAQEIIEEDSWEQLVKQNFPMAKQLLIKMLDIVKIID